MQEIDFTICPVTKQDFVEIVDHRSRLPDRFIEHTVDKRRRAGTHDVHGLFLRPENHGFLRRRLGLEAEKGDEQCDAYVRSSQSQTGSGSGGDSRV